MILYQHGTGDTCRGAPPPLHMRHNRTMPNAEPVGTTTSTAITEAWAALGAENLLT
jgi:hypothetical protein